MTRVIQARVVGNNAAMGRSTPAADGPYLTVHEVLRAGIRRTEGRKDMAAAQSTWESEGGSDEAGVTTRSLCAASSLEGSSETAHCQP